MEPVYATVEAILLPLLSAWYRLDVTGSQHLGPAGPSILACNHVSYVDPLAVGWMLKRRGRRGRFLAKSELFQNPVLRWILTSMGQVPVYRRTSDAGNALRDAEAALRANRDVVIYPEATIGPGLPLLPLKTGAARLSIATGVPVTPMATWGGKSHRPRTRLRVAIGEPLPPGPDADTMTATLGDRMTSLVEQVSCAL